MLDEAIQYLEQYVLTKTKRVCLFKYKLTFLCISKHLLLFVFFTLAQSFWTTGALN